MRLALFQTCTGTAASRGSALPAAGMTPARAPVSDVYRDCGTPDERAVGCEEDYCTCATDGCNAGLLRGGGPPPELAPPSAGLLWWWLMAVPAVAAVLLTAAAVLRLRQRRREEQQAAVTEPAWCETRPQQDPLL